MIGEEAIVKTVSDISVQMDETKFTPAVGDEQEVQLTEPLVEEKKPIAQGEHPVKIVLFTTEATPK